MDPAHENRSESLPAVAAAWQALAPLMDLVTPMALRVAATLRLADEMPDQDNGTIPASELARRAGANADALTRLLRHLARRGVFSEPQPGEFAVNQTAALLRADHPAAMRTWLDLDGFGGRMDLAFTGLAHTVRTGEPAWAQVFGQPFWQYLDANPEISTAFDQTMAGGASYWAAITDGFDWSTYLTGLGLADRFGVAGQSFFDPLPAGADAYLLSKIIHERTLGEYRDLAGTAGLRVVAVHQAVGGPAIIECRAS